MRKKRERIIRINLKALEETSIIWRTKEFYSFLRFFVSFQVSAFIGLLDFPCYATRFKYLLKLVFQHFRGKFRDFTLGFVEIYLSDAILDIVFNYVNVFLIDISSSTIYRHFEMFFLSF